MSRTYSNEDVQEILREATMLQKVNEISQEQLLEIAAEVGISAETVEKAKKAWLERREATQRDTKNII